MSIHILRSWRLLLGAVIVVSVLLAGCTGSSPGPAPATTPATPPPTTVLTTVAATLPTTPVPQTTAAPATPAMPSTAAVTIQNFAFNPSSVTVSAGGTVTWTNRDQATHTVTSDTGAFTSNNLVTGNSYSFTFTTPGTYRYHCSIHTGMMGTVIVT